MITQPIHMKRIHFNLLVLLVGGGIIVTSFVLSRSVISTNMEHKKTSLSLESVGMFLDFGVLSCSYMHIASICVNS